MPKKPATMPATLDQEDRSASSCGPVFAFRYSRPDPKVRTQTPIHGRLPFFRNPVALCQRPAHRQFPQPEKGTLRRTQPPYVGMYVCGPTVYSNVHLGNVRTFLTFDVIFRYLLHLGYKVRYVRNITDVGHLTGDSDDGEDKIGKKARLENIEPMEVVQRYTNDFHDVMRVFNILPPSIEPTATGHIVEQIEMISSIMENGYAYESNGSVYFNVRKFAEAHDYGALSGRRIDELQNQTRALDGQDEKQDPLDFALWKKADDSHLMRWPSLERGLPRLAPRVLRDEHEVPRPIL